MKKILIFSIELSVSGMFTGITLTGLGNQMNEGWVDVFETIEITFTLNIRFNNAKFGFLWSEL